MESDERTRDSHPSSSESSAIGRERRKAVPLMRFPFQNRDREARLEANGGQRKPRNRHWKIRSFVSASRGLWGLFADGTQDNQLDIVTTADPEECERWVRDFRKSGGDCLGLDIEWKSNTAKGQRPEPVATLQLATETSALVLQVLYFDPSGCAALRELLADETVLKLGVGIKPDFLKLFKDCNLHCRGGLDLSKHFKSTLGLKIREEIGLKRLAKFVLGFDMDKPKSLSRSDWSTASLEEDQVTYAALDAVVACRVFEKLRRCDAHEQWGIATRTRYFLQKTFAFRKLKQQSWPKRLLAFGAMFWAVWSPSMAVAGAMGLAHAKRDILCGSWALCALFILMRSYGEEMLKSSRPLEIYFGKWDPSKASSGLALGVALAVSFYAALSLLGFGAPRWVPGAVAHGELVQAAAAGILAGLFQEALFRGLVTKELERDYRKAEGWKAAAIVAVLFASAHRTLDGFLGLALLSLCLSEARKAFRGSLSFPLGLHSGLVAASAVLGRSVYAEMSTAPRWLAGSGPHFLEGALGLAMLSCLYAVLRNKRRKLKSR